MDTTPKTDTHKFRSGYTNIKGPSSRTASVLSTELVGSAEPRQDAKCAIIVNHGMGQQVHFETLELVVLALRDAEMRVRGQKPHDVDTDIVCLQNHEGKPVQLLRAEMNITDKDGHEHRVDVYESYWAPLTEGKVSLWDCIKFLLEGVLSGISYVARYGTVFDRWVFGGMKKFPIQPLLTAFKLAVGLLLLLGPMLLASLVSIPLVSSLFFGGNRFPTVVYGSNGKINLLTAFTPDVICFEICLAGYGFGAWFIPKLYRSKFFAGKIGFVSVLRELLKGSAVTISIVAVVATFIVELRFLYRTWSVVHSPPLPVPPRVLPFAIVWIIALVAALVSRWFLIEYMGDVAAYLSAHKMSKFDELRDNIRTAVEHVMTAVYRARIADNAPLSYDKVIVVGHSLGSVISYDVLNRMLVNDPNLDVQERTKLLLTFGSPLDKSAFLFRVKGGTDELREAAAANWQPMIQDYSFRPERWINLYSWMDIISGRLRFYDDPEGQGNSRNVRNLYDRQAILPLAAHTEYWGNDLFADILYENIVS